MIGMRTGAGTERRMRKATPKEKTNLQPPRRGLGPAFPRTQINLTMDLSTAMPEEGLPLVFKSRGTLTLTGECFGGLIEEEKGEGTARQTTGGRELAEEMFRKIKDSRSSRCRW